MNTEKYEAVLVCGLLKDETPWKDNMTGECGECGAPIQWRPHSPHGPKILKLCAPCAFAEMAVMKMNGVEIETKITGRAKLEVLWHLIRRFALRAYAMASFFFSVISYHRDYMRIAGLSDSEFLEAMNHLKAMPYNIRVICSRRWAKITFPNDKTTDHIDDGRRVWMRDGE